MGPAQEALDNMAVGFGSSGGGNDRQEDREKALLQKIGELTVERDFLANGLGRLR